MTHFPFVVLFLFWIKDFNHGRLITGFVQLCAPTTCRFMYSSRCSWCWASLQLRLCWQWVCCSSAIWVTMYSKSTKPQYIPKSTFWPKWRSESTDLGTCCKKELNLSSGNIYMYWRFFLFFFKNLSTQGEMFILCFLYSLAFEGQCKAVLCVSCVTMYWIFWLFLSCYIYMYLWSFLALF